MSDVTPTAADIDTAHGWLGCGMENNPLSDHRWCMEHPLDLDWPCPVAVKLAAKIAARDALVRADECDQIAAQLHRHLESWGHLVAAGIEMRAALHWRRAGTQSTDQERDQ